MKSYTREEKMEAVALFCEEGKVGQALEFMLAMPAVMAFLALNFTGSSTFTSRTGMKREMFAYIPGMAWTFGTGVLLGLVLVFVR